MKTTIIGVMGKALDQKGNIIGVKRVGKDTFADIVQNKYNKTHRVLRLSFACILKDLASEIRGVQRHVFDDDNTKEKYRQLLEDLGGAIRKVYPDFFIEQVVRNIVQHELPLHKRLVAMQRRLSAYDVYKIDNDKSNQDYKQEIDTMKNSLHDYKIDDKKPLLVLVTDVRFPNEYATLKDMNTVFVQIERITNNQKPSQHSSNKVYNSMKPNFIIRNNKNIKDFIFNSLTCMNKIVM